MLNKYNLLTGSSISSGKFKSPASSELSEISYVFEVQGDDGIEYKINLVLNEDKKLFIVNDFDKYDIWERILEKGKVGLIDLKNYPKKDRLDYVRSSILTVDEINNGGIRSVGEMISYLDNIIQNGTPIWVLGEDIGESQGSPLTEISAIHLNQGYTNEYSSINGIYQDGGLIFQTPENKIIAYLFSSEMQLLPTDDNGNPITN